MKKIFELYCIVDTSTNKIINNLTNPKHKYYDRKVDCEKAIANYNPLLSKNKFKNINKDSLQVVTINCKVQE